MLFQDLLFSICTANRIVCSVSKAYLHAVYQGFASGISHFVRNDINRF